MSYLSKLYQFLTFILITAVAVVELVSEIAHVYLVYGIGHLYGFCFCH
jgi:hypothetical protein